jgi:hypothetical protein
MSEIQKVVLVGQPRSGTSMMMRVLLFGGVDCEFNDDVRPEPLKRQFRNIHGFFETKNRKTDKCFKCFNPAALIDIPDDWRVIHIERSINGVFNSWEAVHSRPIKDEMKEEIQTTRRKIHRVLDKFGFSVLRLDYDEVCTNPIENIEKIREFLLPDDFNAGMALTAIDPSLYVSRG